MDNDLLLEVGKVAVLRGELRFNLLSAGDAMLSTRLTDQGIARLMMNGCELLEICKAMQILAQARGVAPEAVQQLAHIATEYGDDFDSAGAIANGSWTYLGGVEEKSYGLFLGESARDGDLAPLWQKMTVEDLRKLVKRLEDASRAMQPFIWSARHVFETTIKNLRKSDSSE